MVRGIPTHADAHHPYHPYQPSAVRPESRECAAHPNQPWDHDGRGLASVLAIRCDPWVRDVARSLLAITPRNPVPLRPAYPSREDVAPQEGVDLRTAESRSPRETVIHAHAPHAFTACKTNHGFGSLVRDPCHDSECRRRNLAGR